MNKENRTGNIERDIILDSINEGVFTIGSDWKITSFNRAAEVITGIPGNEAIGQNCSDVFHANICEKDCALRKTFETGKPVINTTAYVINNRGDIVPIRISTAILRDDTGNVMGGVETFQDLSQAGLKPGGAITEGTARSPYLRRHSREKPSNDAPL
jgi:PAS domain S-box-containing protein